MSDPKNHENHKNPFVAWVNGETFRKEEEKKAAEKKKKVKKEVDISVHHDRFHKIYKPVCVVLCCAFIALLIFVCIKTPPFGITDAPTNNEVAQKYIEEGLEDTGATNIVAGMILDYRAFDTLGESSVLFTAVMAVIILLKKDEDRKKEMTEKQKQIEARQQKEEELNDRHRDVILKKTSGIIAPFILMFGIYVVLNGHISPGGGFSGGAIIGAGLILISQAFGSKQTKKFFNFKVFTIITSGALLSYAALKTYSFYTGSHHMETGVPHGIPGAILSSGFILPLNIFVGLIVACTMFGFYSLFSKGEI